MRNQNIYLIDTVQVKFFLFPGIRNPTIRRSNREDFVSPPSHEATKNGLIKILKSEIIVTTMMFSDDEIHAVVSLYHYYRTSILPFSLSPVLPLAPSSVRLIRILPIIFPIHTRRDYLYHGA